MRIRLRGLCEGVVRSRSIIHGDTVPSSQVTFFNNQNLP